jgi:GT2 family glycosyltransferase
LKERPDEVILVDSNSTDGTERLRKRFPIRYVSISERNRERARNVGISQASGDVVIFLDDDVVVHRDWLNRITEPYGDRKVGGVGGRVVPYGRLESFHVKTRWNKVGRVFESGLVIGNFDVPLSAAIEVDSLIGCNMSFRKDVLLKVGGFDGNYLGTGYRDDTDICMRVRRLGYQLMYQPKALVWHKFRGGQTRMDWSYWYVRNHTYFYFKNLFAQSKTSFFRFLYSMFFPPRDYVSKSEVKIKIQPFLAFNAVKGLYDGYETWRKSGQGKNSSFERRVGDVKRHVQ